MKTLVFGGNGFIGSHLVELLLQTGYPVRVYDRSDEPTNLPPACRSRVEYVWGEFGNQGLVRSALTNIDCVFHLVCTTLPATSNDDVIFDIRSNLVDTIQLLEECVRAGVQRVIFVSSGGTVYGLPQTVPISESHPTEPLCSYGITKLAIEKYLALFHHLHGLNYCVLRVSNPYGERQHPLRPQGAVGVFLSQIARGEVITVWGDGEIVRDYLYVGDVARALYQAARTTLEQHRIFNIGSGRGLSINQLLRCLSEITQENPQVRYVEGRKLDVPVIVLDAHRARQELGWSPEVSLEEGLKRTWAWIRENRHQGETS